MWEHAQFYLLIIFVANLPKINNSLKEMLIRTDVAFCFMHAQCYSIWVLFSRNLQELAEQRRRLTIFARFLRFIAIYSDL
jgi:hypothetical protein